MLVRRPNIHPIDLVRPRQQRHIVQAAHQLTMLHQEWDFMGSDLKHRRSPLDVAGTMPESGIEESRVMDAELAVRGIERHHLGGELRRNAYSLFGGKYVEVAGLENQVPAGILVTNFPEFLRRIKIN